LQLIKKKWVVWGASILLSVIIIALGVIQVRQMGQRDSLSEDLEIAERLLSALETETSSSEQSDNATQPVDMDTAEEELSQPADSILANEAIFSIANISSVTLTSITVLPLSDDSLGTLSCFSLPLNVAAEGDVPYLIDFINRLNTDLTNGLVRSASLSIPETPTEGEASANIELVIYTY